MKRDDSLLTPFIDQEKVLYAINGTIQKCEKAQKKCIHCKTELPPEKCPVYCGKMDALREMKGLYNLSEFESYEAFMRVYDAQFGLPCNIQSLPEEDGEISIEDYLSIRPTEQMNDEFMGFMENEYPELIDALATGTNTEVLKDFETFSPLNMVDICANHLGYSYKEIIGMLLAYISDTQAMAETPKSKPQDKPRVIVLSSSDPRSKVIGERLKEILSKSDPKNGVSKKIENGATENKGGMPNEKPKVAAILDEIREKDREIDQLKSELCEEKLRAIKLNFLIRKMRGNSVVENFGEKLMTVKERYNSWEEIYEKLNAKEATFEEYAAECKRLNVTADNVDQLREEAISSENGGNSGLTPEIKSETGVQAGTVRDVPSTTVIHTDAQGFIHIDLPSTITIKDWESISNILSKVITGKGYSKN